jgi:hypothetical protein
MILESAVGVSFSTQSRAKLRYLLRRGFLLRQGFGGQDGGQENYDWQEDRRDAAEVDLGFCSDLDIVTCHALSPIE